jgi:hypothetical protein
VLHGSITEGTPYRFRLIPVSGCDRDTRTTERASRTRQLTHGLGLPREEAHSEFERGLSKLAESRTKRDTRRITVARTFTHSHSPWPLARPS